VAGIAAKKANLRAISCYTKIKEAVMMFKNTIDQLDKFFGTAIHSNFTEDLWKKNQNEFIHIFHDDLDPLNNLSHEKPFEVIFQHSKSEYVLWPVNSVSICEFRIRPNNQYYTILNKPIPQPDNPSGPSATGIEVCVSVYRGIEKDNIFYPASIEIKFDVWGHYERKNFKKLYRNYKRPIDVLLNDIQLEFFTPCVFDSIERYKGNDTVRKLNLYLPKKDSEASFSVSRSLNKNSNEGFVKRHFRNMLILYHCCLGYCLENNQLDVALNYSDVISGIIGERITCGFT